MAHFSKIDENNIVVDVIVAERDFINSGLVGDPKFWIQTSYNTYGGINRRGAYPVRKNYGAIGSYYDAQRDVFIPPKPYEHFVFDEYTCTWYDPDSIIPSGLQKVE